MTALVFAELDADGVADASLRALTLARGFGGVAVAVFSTASPDAARTAPTSSDVSDSPVTATLGAHGVSDSPVTATLGTHGASDIYEISVDGYAPQAWGRALAGLIEETGASAVLAAGTDHGNEVLAHVGAITGLPMAANVLSVTPASPLVLTRQRWAGLLLEDAVLDAPVALLTVATDAVEAEPAAESLSPQVHAVKPELSEADSVVQAATSAAGAGGASLATARVVVGGGRGVGGAEGFTPLEELAELLGGVVGVSRVVTSEGWRPHTMQVGQTGTKITPELYLACGISGAIQHIAGCSGAKHIIAINTDPNAPIFAHADYAVIGDLHQVIPALVQLIKSRGAPVSGSRS
jgi:electron transfer flavoprotein alpha subunit